jgi:hypothetical protein
MAGEPLAVIGRIPATAATATRFERANIGRSFYVYLK